MLGKVKNLVERKAFGFIKGQDGQEYFFHKDDFIGFWEDMEEGKEVDFTPAKSPKGLRAQNVSFTNWPDTAVK